MAKAGRVQHWKHGWIPVSMEARLYKAGRGPRPLTGKDAEWNEGDALARIFAHIDNYRQETGNEGRGYRQGEVSLDHHPGPINQIAAALKPLVDLQIAAPNEYKRIYGNKKPADVLRDQGLLR